MYSLAPQAHCASGCLDVNSLFCCKIIFAALIMKSSSTLYPAELRRYCESFCTAYCCLSSHPALRMPPQATDDDQEDTEIEWQRRLRREYMD
jgi:hypothetical protein